MVMRRQARAVMLILTMVAAGLSVMGTPAALGASSGESKSAGVERVEALLEEVDSWIATDDPRVRPSDPRRFAWVLEKLGKDVFYREETEFGHGVSGRAKLTHDLAASYTFIFDHIME